MGKAKQQKDQEEEKIAPIIPKYGGQTPSGEMGQTPSGDDDFARRPEF